ncbi:MAG: hypothetical protein P8P83_03995 [Rickettsiaceae bacterium]|nr:hypothetical protein [Rickettsiaceae bacterium]
MKSTDLQKAQAPKDTLNAVLGTLKSMTKSIDNSQEPIVNWGHVKYFNTKADTSFRAYIIADLVGVRQKINNFTSEKFLRFLDVAKDGNIQWLDSTTESPVQKELPSDALVHIGSFLNIFSGDLERDSKGCILLPTPDVSSNYFSAPVSSMIAEGNAGSAAAAEEDSSTNELDLITDNFASLTTEDCMELLKSCVSEEQAETMDFNFTQLDANLVYALIANNTHAQDIIKMLADHEYDIDQLIQQAMDNNDANVFETIFKLDNNYFYNSNYLNDIFEKAEEFGLNDIMEGLKHFDLAQSEAYMEYRSGTISRATQEFVPINFEEAYHEVIMMGD